MLTWPHAHSDWADALAHIEPVCAQIGAAIARRQRLLVLCQDDVLAARARRKTIAAGGNPSCITTLSVTSDDTWARDYGPLTVIDRDGVTLCDFRFDGWGGKYAAERDNAITRTLHQRGLFGAARLRRLPLVLEGGAIETDGQGTLLATRRSVVCAARNPAVSEASIEQTLGDVLGASRILWLETGGLSGDDTDGHIDNLARFADAETILYVTTEPDDADFDALRGMYRQLKALRTRAGRAYRLIALPPAGRHFDGDRRLPATYANFLLINGAVLLPVYGVANDGPAMSVLQGCFRNREIIPIDCRPVIRQNGSLHCLTLQLPAAVALAG